MERQGLTGETKTCDAHARRWCLRVSTLTVVVIVFLAMLFYSWGGVLFDDGSYLAAYVNGCTNVSFGMIRVNDTSWRLEKDVDVFWIPVPANASIIWDGTELSLGCVSALGIGFY